MKTPITLAVLSFGLLIGMTQIAQANVRSNFFIAPTAVLTDLTGDRSKQYDTVGITLDSLSVIDASSQATSLAESANTQALSGTLAQSGPI